MKTKLSISALALLLLAGMSGGALAQDRDRGDRGQGQALPQAHPQQAPHAGAPSGAPGGGHGPGGPQGGPQGGLQGGQGHGREGRGGPPQGGPQAAPQFGQGRGAEGRGGSPQGGAPRQGFQGSAPGPVAPQRFNHDQGQGPAPGGDRGFDGRRDGHGAGAQVDARNGAGAPRGQAPRWQPGRYPPVYASHDRFHAGAYRAPYGYYSRAWGFGDFLPRAWFGESYWIGDFIDYGLPYPPPGYEWVRVGGDALMIDRYTGRIVQVVRGIFW